MKAFFRGIRNTFLPGTRTLFQKNIDNLIKEICNLDKTQELRLEKYKELLQEIKDKKIGDFSPYNLYYLYTISDDLAGDKRAFRDLGEPVVVSGDSVDAGEAFREQALPILESEYNTTILEKRYTKTNFITGSYGFRENLNNFFSSEKASIHALAFFYHRTKFEEELQDLSDLLGNIIFRKSTARERFTAEQSVGELIPVHGQFKGEHKSFFFLTEQQRKQVSKSKSDDERYAELSKIILENFKNSLKNEKKDINEYLYKGFIEIAKKLNDKVLKEPNIAIADKERMKLATLIYLVRAANNSILPKPRVEATFEYDSRPEDKISSQNPIFKEREYRNITLNTDTKTEYGSDYPNRSESLETGSSLSISDNNIVQTQKPLILEAEEEKSLAGDDPARLSIQKGVENITPQGRRNSISPIDLSEAIKPPITKQTQLQKKMSSLPNNDKPKTGDVYVRFNKSKIELFSYFYDQQQRVYQDSEKKLMENCANEVAELAKNFNDNQLSETKILGSTPAIKSQSPQDFLKESLNYFSIIAGQKIGRQVEESQGDKEAFDKMVSLIKEAGEKVEVLKRSLKSPTADPHPTPGGKLLPVINSKGDDSNLL